MTNEIRQGCIRAAADRLGALHPGLGICSALLLESPMTFEVVDIPTEKSIGGRFAHVLDGIDALLTGKCVKLDRLKESEKETLRQAARHRGYKVHIRTIKGTQATFVWKSKIPLKRKA